MQQQLIDHSADLLKLRDGGYDMEIKGGQYLLVHQIPYVNAMKEVKYGTLVCVLTLRTPTVLGVMLDHTVYFIGETPCQVDGTPFDSIIINSSSQNLAAGIVVNFHFSSKPKKSGRFVDYVDYYEKVKTYIDILSSQAKAIDPNITSKPKKQVI